MTADATGDRTAASSTGIADTAATVWRQMRSLVLEQHDRRAEVSVALGLSFSRFKALQYVAVSPMTMRELAERLNTDRPYTTVMVDDLEKRGLVRRQPHPDDRRLKIVSVTAAGLTAAARADGILGRPPGFLLALTAADLGDLARILDAVASGDTTRPPGETTRPTSEPSDTAVAPGSVRAPRSPLPSTA